MTKEQAIKLVYNVTNAVMLANQSDGKASAMKREHNAVKKLLTAMTAEKITDDDAHRARP